MSFTLSDSLRSSSDSPASNRTPSSPAAIRSDPRRDPLRPPHHAIDRFEDEALEQVIAKEQENGDVNGYEKQQGHRQTAGREIERQPKQDHDRHGQESDGQQHRQACQKLGTERAVPAGQCQPDAEPALPAFPVGLSGVVLSPVRGFLSLRLRLVGQRRRRQ
jgi:hypothetical protein